MNKNYLILGGSSGIGLEISKKLSKENNIIIVSRNKIDFENIEELNESNCIHYAFDLNYVDKIGEIFDFINKKNISLDGMIYCAGISPLCLLKDNNSSIMQEIYNVNLFSYIECCKYFYINAKEESKIISIASIAAHTSGYRQTLYGSSKAAMIAANKLMAKELLNRKITVNSISPGSVKTKLLMDLYDNDEKRIEESLKNKQLLGIIEPDNIADIVINMLNENYNKVTGQEFIYDGGFLLN